MFRDIFQSRPILECSLPTPQVILPVDETTIPQEPEVGRRSRLDQGTSAKLSRGDHSADVFSKVIRHNKADLSFLGDCDGHVGQGHLEMADAF